MTKDEKLNLFPAAAFDNLRFREVPSLMDLLKERREKDWDPANRYLKSFNPWIAVRSSEILDVISSLNAWPTLQLEDWGGENCKNKQLILPPIDGTILILNCYSCVVPKHRAQTMNALSLLGGRVFWFSSWRNPEYEVWKNGETIRKMTWDDNENIVEFGDPILGEPAVTESRYAASDEDIRKAADRGEHLEKSHTFRWIYDVDVFEFADAMRANPLRLAPLSEGEKGYCWSW